MGMDQQPGDVTNQGGPADAAPPTGRPKKRLFIVLAAAIVLAGGVGFGVWYAITPHSAAQQFAAADKLETQLATKGKALDPAKREALRGKVVEAYKRVFTEFDPSHVAAESPKAHVRLAEMEQRDGRVEEARSWWDKLTRDYPNTPEARQAYRKLEESYARQADGLIGTGKKPQGLEMFEKAAKTADDFTKHYGDADPDSSEMAMIRCRIIQDKIVDPVVRAIETIEDFLKRFPASPLMDEALLRAGQSYEQAAEFGRAQAYYKRLIDEFPKSPLLKRAELGYARTLSKTDPAKAEEYWRELAKKYPDEPEVQRELTQLEQAKDSRKSQQAKKEAQDYRSSRYGGGGGGGGGPMDSGWGKPVPPHEMLKDFIAQNLDAKHYKLVLTVNPAEHSIHVTGSLEVTNDGDAKKDCLLMLGSLFEVRQFTIDGQPAKASRPAGKADVLFVELPAQWDKGQTVTIGFDYAAKVSRLVIPKEIAEKAIEQLSRRDPAEGMTVLAQPTSQAEKDASTEPAGDEGSFNPATLLSDPRLQLQINDTGFALSGAAWYPITIMGDLFTAEVTFEIQGDGVGLCSGRLADSHTDAGKQVTVWQCEQPYFGLYFAYGPYKVLTRDMNGVPLSAYFLPDQADKAAGYLDASQSILEFYSQKFGKFPFEKLTVAQVDLPPVLGGVGPASMIMLHSLAIQRKTKVPVNLLAHELSHQWWGNLVPINLIDSHYSQWLSEGFATYCDALYTEHTKGPEALREHVRKMGKLYLDESASTREDALIDTFMGQNPLYRVTVYEKGSLVLHALRFVVGDEAFFQILRQYADGCSFKRSTVDDFRRLASQAAGRNLDWFFDEWLDRPGCPCFVLQSVKLTPGAAGQTSLDIQIDQPQQLSHMPLELAVEGTAGQSKRFRFNEDALGKKENTVRASVDFPVKRVVLDPDNWVLRRTQGSDTWENPPLP